MPLPRALAQTTTDENDNRVKNRFNNDATADYDQSHPDHRKLTLNVGGVANLYSGTSIKVKCPVRNFARHRIVWTKDGEKVKSSEHIKVSSNGALRIFHAKEADAGLYECFANGAPQGNVTLRFKPRGASKATSNTVEKAEDLDELKSADDVDEQLIQVQLKFNRF
jgi:hypothetical protein